MEVNFHVTGERLIDRDLCATDTVRAVPILFTFHTSRACLKAALARSSLYEGAEKLLDAGFFNAFEDDFDESDMSM